ncbi:ATP-binding cassette domain-containing protein [Algoriphagus hitonicola]|uniref:Molybdate transport system ATP-binding protein n=1 Tax=Algoriphagus hitonicola TaxID=435880 RepID=A0A1I2PG55_9BACT|nr:ATP-binding cassette domain-containing protein [Algoriphagus hitonicola]SFG12411.1 molybdate transport system ATP-binding protein [Algoriphagus hitonicola]
MSSSLIDINRCEVHYKRIQVVDSLSFSWEKGQHWAIIAESGSLQTAFVETIRGNSVILKGAISRDFAADYLEKEAETKQLASYRDLISYISQAYVFRNKSNLQNFYFQQRFNATESEESDTVTEYLNKISGQKSGKWTVGSVLELMKLTDLADKSLLKLSNGESRRLAIAGGLLRQPSLFIMDHPMTGLDVQTRLDFGGILKRISDSGIHVLMTTTADEIPEGITHVAELHSHGIRKIWTRDDFHFQSAGQLRKAWDWRDLNHLLPETRNNQDCLIDLRKVSIRYGEKRILQEVDWRVNAGEKWLLQGPNGSGKSTLISLLIGENPQAYSQEIYLFGKKRGTGESIWDIKRPVGFMAPELARFFPTNQTCRKVILSGLFDTMGLFKKPTESQEDAAKGWMKFFELSEDSDRLFSRLPLEKQRWALLARALIKQPALLVLDEASQGMDTIQRQLFKDTVTKVCERYSPALIFVSHYEEDVPEVIDRIIKLKEGQASLV